MAACGPRVPADSAARSPDPEGGPSQERIPVPREGETARETAARDSLLHLLQSLRGEIETVARTRILGEESSGECAVRPVGEKPCGGPSFHVVYAPAATDTVALDSLTALYLEAQRRLVREGRLVSDCRMVRAPAVEAVGGLCVARSPRP